MTRTALYRHYDAQGALLYVGISLCPMMRTAQHEEKGEWYGEIATIKIEWLHTRAEAEQAERVAIRDESPRENIRHACITPAQVFIDTVTPDILAARLGVGLHSIRNARWRGVMPASWALVVAELCLEQHLSCPSNAFSWKGGSGDDATPIHERLYPSAA